MNFFTGDGGNVARTMAPILQSERLAFDVADGKELIVAGEHRFERFGRGGIIFEYLDGHQWTVLCECGSQAREHFDLRSLCINFNR